MLRQFLSGCERLPLRELEALAGLGSPWLLPLYLARVTREESAGSQRRTQLLVMFDNGAGDPHTNGVRLARQAATVDANHHVELSIQFCGLQRL